MNYPSENPKIKLQQQEQQKLEHLAEIAPGEIIYFEGKQYIATVDQYIATVDPGRGVYTISITCIEGGHDRFGLYYSPETAEVEMLRGDEKALSAFLIGYQAHWDK